MKSSLDAHSDDTTESPILDYRALFEAAPGHFLVVTPDEPNFMVVAATDSYLMVAGKTREELVGRSLFELFPGGPDPSHADTMEALRVSLRRVLATGQPDTMPVQRYDLPRSGMQDGSLEERHWSPVNSPLLNTDGQVLYIVHRVEDVTERLRADRLEALRSSEERLRRALEIDTVGVTFFDLEGNLHYCNDAFLRMSGYSRQELPLRWEKLTPDEWMPVTHHIAQQLVASGTATPYEKESIRKDGSRWWGLFAPRMLSEREAVEFVLDITQRRQAEKEREEVDRVLDRRAAELEAVLASLPDALYIGDQAGIHRVNQLALDQLGFSTIEELQADIADLGERIRTRDPRTGQRLRPEEEPFVRALRGESVAREVATTHLVTGEEVIVRCSARPIRLDGKILGAIAINTDITAEKRNEALLAQQAAELARSNEELQQFAHVAAHDLQTPLRMIQTYSQLLQRRYQGQLDDVADEFIRHVVKGVTSMTELTEGLLQLAQAGEGSPDRMNIRIGTVVDDVLTNLQPSTQETRATVTCGDLPTVVADRLQLLQLFQNLIGNALKYRDPERPPQIRITAELRDGAYCFAVADNGLGIEAKHHERIFAPLKRLHGGEIPGTGIGLAVCKKIVERHGGRIWVDSEPGQGSTFYFTLPSL